MEILITKTFEKFISKHFSNYFIDLEDFSFEIKKSFFEEMYLKRPIMKFKIKINRLSYRVVWLVKNEKIVPILIFLKKDKKKWENLICNKELEILINHYSWKIQLDIKNDDVKVY